MKDSEKILIELIGKTEKDAYILCQSEGFSPRVVSRDGVSFVVTCDLRFNRINLYIEDNLIVRCNIG